jgi:autotransporter-associated beta strand protein
MDGDNALGRWIARIHRHAIEVGLSIIAALAAGALLATHAQASIIGQDYANNYSSSGWTNGSNDGTGFGAWAFQSQTNGSNTFAGQFNDHDETGDNIGSYAWGEFANDSVTGDDGLEQSAAYRPFASSLSVGESFHVTLENEDIATAVDPSSGSAGAVGITIRNGNVNANTGDYNAQSRFEFSFVGGDGNYSIFDNTNSQNATGIPFTNAGVRLNFVLTSSNTYNLFVRTIGTSPQVVYNFIGRTLGGTAGSTLDSIALFDRNRGSSTTTGQNAYFNSLELLDTTGDVWTGGGGNANQSTSANWAGALAPIDGDTLTFLGSTNTSPNVDVIQSAEAINFASAATATFAVSGNALGIAAGITNSSASNQIVNNALTLLAAQTFNSGTASGGALTLGGSITNAGNTLTLAGSNNLTLSGAITGTGGVTLQGSGIATLSNTANTYTGATNIISGTLALTGALGNTAIAVGSGGTLAPAAGVSVGSTTAGTAGATLNLQSGSALDLSNGTIGNFNLNQQASFAGTALTVSGATLDFDLSSTGADDLFISKGSAAVSGTNTINITPVGTSLTNGSKTIISVPSGLTGTFLFPNGHPSEVTTAGTHLYLLTLNNSSTSETVTVANGSPQFGLTSAAPSGFGTQLTSGFGANQGTFTPNNPANQLTVTGNNGSYQPGFVDLINGGAGDSANYVQVGGFVPSNDTEVFLLKLLNNGSALTPGNGTTNNDLMIDQIVNDINTTYDALNSTTATIASPLTSAGYQGNFQGYDVLLTFNSSTPGFASNGYFGFNFTDYTASSAGGSISNVTVTDIAVIPEPSTLLCLGMVMASQWLLGQRRGSRKS